MFSRNRGLGLQEDCLDTAPIDGKDALLLEWIVLLIGVCEIGKDSLLFESSDRLLGVVKVFEGVSLVVLLLGTNFTEAVSS